jgi:HK97 family phage portal protein
MLRCRWSSRGGDDDIRIAARDHWAYSLLHDSPNADQTSFEFFETGAAALELKGNMLAYKDRTGSRVTALLPMHWHETRIYRREDGRVGYEWKGEKLTSDEVLHVRGFGGNDLGGLSTIAVAASAFGLARAVNKSASGVFRNGIRSQVVLGSERDLTQDQMEDTRRIVDERYAGAVNGGRPLILNAGWKATALSINPEDAQLLESRGFNVEEVCRFFGVPPVLVGHSEKQSSWGTGIEQIVLGFLKFTMRPRLRRMEQALEKQLLSADDRAKGVRIEFNVEGLLRASSKERAEFYTAALGDTQKPGWMVRNEVRRKENLSPIPGWDEPVQMFQQAPRATANDA